MYQVVKWWHTSSIYLNISMGDKKKLLDKIQKLKDHMHELAELCGKNNCMGVVSYLDEAYFKLEQIECELEFSKD